LFADFVEFSIEPNTMFCEADE